MIRVSADFYGITFQIITNAAKITEKFGLNVVVLSGLGYSVLCTQYSVLLLYCFPQNSVNTPKVAFG